MTQPTMNPGGESIGPQFTEVVRVLEETNADIRAAVALAKRKERLHRELLSGQTTGAGGFVANTAQVGAGFEVEIERIRVSVGGASSAATVAVYLGAIGASGGQEGYLEDFANGLLGSNPSRQVAEYTPPIRLGTNELLTIVISGAVTSQQVYIRIQGLKKEIL